MVTYLEELFSQTDVRTHIDTTFKLQEFKKKYAVQKARKLVLGKEKNAIIKDAQESLFMKNVPGKEDK